VPADLSVLCRYADTNISIIVKPGASMGFGTPMMPPPPPPPLLPPPPLPPPLYVPIVATVVVTAIVTAIVTIVVGKCKGRHSPLTQELMEPDDANQVQ
jgi:hypothetical protein